MNEFIECENKVTTRKGETCNYEAKYIVYLEDENIKVCKHHLNKLLDKLEKENKPYEYDSL